MFKVVVFAALLALAVAAPAPAPAPAAAPGIAYSGVVAGVPSVAAYSVPAVSTYAASPVVASYGVRSVGYTGYSGYSPYGYGVGVPLTYY